MTPTQCVDLVQFLADRCPAMRMQDGTPDAWYVDLVAVDFADGMEAVLRCTRRQTFVGLNDLLAECEAITRQRAGEQRRAEREAEIAAENDGDADLEPVTSGGPAFPLALEAGPLHQRFDEVQAGRREARDRFAARREAEAEQKRRRQERKAKRAEIEAELDSVRGETA